MLDLSHIPNSQQDIKIFFSNGIANAWQTWQKPRKCQWVWIMAIGGGGGGSSSFGGSYTNGGGTGAVTRALFNASHLPDTLFIQVGIGGAGAIGAAGIVAGGAGSKSYIGIRPTTSTTELIMGSGATATSGGTGESPFTVNQGASISLANFISTLGVTNPGGDITPFTSQINTPGGWHSGNTTTAGSSILSSSISPLIQGGASVASGTGGKGADGITSWKPFYSLGGAGGGGSQNGVGGNGGNGGIGSGGGWGGAGTTTGGNGGKGGDGLVVIISF